MTTTCFMAYEGRLYVKDMAFGLMTHRGNDSNLKVWLVPVLYSFRDSFD
jgi:hypothetical protein